MKERETVTVGTPTKYEEKTTITLVIHETQISSETSLPENIRIVVKDYDCPEDFDGLKTDSDGDTYQEIVLGD